MNITQKQLSSKFLPKDSSLLQHNEHSLVCSSYHFHHIQMWAARHCLIKLSTYVLLNALQL